MWTSCLPSVVSLPCLRLAGIAALVCSLCLDASSARADLALSKVVVDFASARPTRDDIEISNSGNDILYVGVEPSEIVNPGRPDERRVADPNPRQLGLLVSPNRLVLGPGERKVVRLSLLDRPNDRDRIYRVTVKPVIGEIVATQSALKVVVGYDVLVIARPQNARPLLKVARNGSTVEFRNVGNTNALLFNGQQCNEQGTDCAELPSKRIYAGNAWQFELPTTGQGKFMIESEGGITVETF
jgi:P pilus assembly chaperone PapD